MIFYTLQGPTYELEIYEDKIRLVKKPWTQLFYRKEEVDTFNINELSHFSIAASKFMIFSGKLQWATFNGQAGTFRFTTHPAMVRKIETYLQKRVIKNLQQANQTKLVHFNDSSEVTDSGPGPEPAKKKKKRAKEAAA